MSTDVSAQPDAVVTDGNGDDAETPGGSGWFTPDELAAALTAPELGSSDQLSSLIASARSADIWHGPSYYTLLSLLRSLDAPELADELHRSLGAQHADDPWVLTATGDALFAQSRFLEARQAYEKVVLGSSDTARAHFGIGLVLESERNLASARRHYLEAYEQSPNDGDVLLALARSASDHAERARYYREALEAEVLEPSARAYYTKWAQIYETSGERGHCRLEGAPTRQTVKLQTLRPDGSETTGHALKVGVNGAKPVRLLLDTGANGITITGAKARELGLQDLGVDQLIVGIGDQGAKTLHVALAESIEIGGVRFRDCLVEIGEEHLTSSAYGIVGADVFYHDFLLTLDFGAARLHLEPHPNRRATNSSMWSQDRDLSLAERGFWDVRIVAGKVLVPTLLNRERRSWFLLDTGASTSVVDIDAAAEVTKLLGTFARVQGISGEVRDVRQAHRIEMAFAGKVQEHRDMLAIDLNTPQWSRGYRLDGIIGYSFLEHVKVTLDYRNALLRID